MMDMMMGGMGGSGGAMGMGGGAAASMNGSVGMNMGNMSNIPGMMAQGTVNGMDPNAMNGMAGIGNYGQGAGTMGLFNSGGSTLGSLFGGIFNLAVDLLAILLVVGLVVGAVVLIKRLVFDNEVFLTKRKTACPKCGGTINAGWNCCPNCGTAVITRTQPVTVNPQTV